MFILEFNTSTFSFYEFSQHILLSPLAARHMHIVLTRDNYVVYDNESRIVFDVGTVTQHDWIKILEPTFVHVVHSKVLSDDDSLSNLKMTMEAFNALIAKNGIEEKYHQYFIGKINSIISEINSKFISIKNFKKKIEEISGSSFGDSSKLEFSQTVVNGDWSFNDTESWYLAWSLDLDTGTTADGKMIHDTTNIGDIEFISENTVLLHPRARILESTVPNKYMLITSVMNAEDTMCFNKSGIEYRITLNDIAGGL